MILMSMIFCSSVLKFLNICVVSIYTIRVGFHFSTFYISPTREEV